MQISPNVYMISGVQHGTNSNCYVIHVNNQLLLFDAGYSVYQFGIMQESLGFWNLDKFPVKHTFITHCHFDHAGNTHMFKELGSKIYAGPGDAEGIEQGDKRTLDYLFKREFTPCKVDYILKDKDSFQIEDVKILALHMPGHSSGSMMYLAAVAGRKILITGDFIALRPAGPVDDVEVDLAWTGGPDYSAEDYLNSITRAATLDADILLPGHGPVYYGDCKKLFKRAKILALKQRDV
jgi:glyoxylase-like metal-dependent hydrolase (beta-lactamase superfamily II)